MAPWDAFRDSSPLFVAVTLVLLPIAASYMYDWRYGDLSYRLNLPFLELEGTLHGIEPRIPPGLDAAAAPWVVAFTFFKAAMILAVYCGRPGLSPWAHDNTHNGDGLARRPQAEPAKCHGSAQSLTTPPKCGGARPFGGRPARRPRPRGPRLILSRAPRRP